MTCTRILTAVLAIALLAPAAEAQWETVWQAGAPGRAWRADDGGIQFVQEAGENEAPGDPNSPVEDQGADDDFYFEGVYPAPIGDTATELAVERAFAGTDNALRFHFNLPADLNDSDVFRFSFEPNNLHTGADIADPRYGIEIYMNGTLVREEQVIRPDDLNQVYTSDPFSAADVSAIAGPGGDNVLLVQGVSYSDDGGGNWMGMQYHHLEVMPIPEPGSLAMMLSGLMWFVPIAAYERRSK